MARTRTVDAESTHKTTTALPATGDVGVVHQPIERVTDVDAAMSKAATLAFMEEVVEVLIHDSTDPNAEPHVFLSVNGKGPGEHGIHWVPRNKPVPMKRMFVERLARAKNVAVRTPEVTDARGDRTTIITTSSALKYPFSVIHDPNPKGVDWLKKILAEP